MYGVRDDTRCQWVSAWPLNVQYVGGEGVWPGLMSLVSRDGVGVKGVRDVKSSVSCEVSCEVSRRCVLQGV